MIATYRIQLHPGFGLEEARALLPYLKRLGVSHLYLSPITEARGGSAHGYDVTDHNRIRNEIGGADGFWRLLKSARAVGISLALDFVPNHAGVGAHNARWQDVLAYGPHSPYAHHFDIDWEPLKPELRHKVLLPFLGTTYGQALEAGEIRLVFEEGRLAAAAGSGRFSLAPHTYADVLSLLRPAVAGTEEGEALATIEESARKLRPHERGRADVLRRLLGTVLGRIDAAGLLSEIRGEVLHRILERQFWRLSYWRTAAHEINYRRFFDINDLVALRMESPDVFADTHRLLSRLVVQPGIEGVRIDHIDGIFDPQDYLDRLRQMGCRRIWVEKILAPGETLPLDWPVDGTSGYEFLNDAMGVLTRPEARRPLERTCRRFTQETLSYPDVVYQSKRLVMDTALPGELLRLAHGLDRISESDYHTRDFTLEALREAIAEVAAAFPRYRTYLPHYREEAGEVVRAAAHEARLRNPGTEPTAYAFIARVLLGDVAPALAGAARRWTGRFQQYTAPLAAKGVEDTAFYRYLLMVAHNEVGGEPDRFGVTPHAFHARARFRAHRYPENLLATATHDHKRGEDTRMRMIVLAELPEPWRRTVGLLSRMGRRHRGPGGPSRHDEYLFFQVLVALWEGADPKSLGERLAAYMCKAAREAKLRTNWLDPDLDYEEALDRYVRGMVADPRVARAVEPLARMVARHGFINSLSQVVLKVTSPGVPDFYQGCELTDLTLVDPDNRRPVDFEHRGNLLSSMEGVLASPREGVLWAWIDGGDERAKLYFIARLLRFRGDHPALFASGYRALEPEGPLAEHGLAYTRESEDEAMIVFVPRFPAALAQGPGWEGTGVPVPAHLAGRAWTEILTGRTYRVEERVEPGGLSLPWAVLFSAGRPPSEPAVAGGRA